MKAVSLLFMLVLHFVPLCSQAAQLQVRTSETPMAMVANLLSHLRARVVSDGKVEQMSYDKYACWIEETLVRKAASISEAKEQIAKLQTQIIRLKGEVGAHSANIQQLEKGIKNNLESQREATEIRSRDSTNYEAEKVESEQCVGALEAAIKVLAGAGTNRGFLETMREAELLSVVAQVRGVLERPATARKVGDSEDLQLIRRFVERPEEFVGGRSGVLSAAQISNNPFGDYAPQSTRIQGVLKGMYDAFTADLEKDNAEEAEAQKAYLALLATKKRELQTLEVTLEQQQLDMATKTRKIAENKALLDDTKEQLEVDEKFFEETKSMGQSKAMEWSKRSQLRTEELMGIGQAINFLTNPDALKVFQNSTTTFVQLSSAIRRSRKNAGGARQSAYRQVAHLAQRFHSLGLARLAVEVKAGGHFDKVITSIDKMITNLRQEEQDDIEHRDRCQAAANKNTNDIEDLGSDIAKAGSSIALLQGEQRELQTQVSGLQTEIDATKVEIQRVLDLRNEEAAGFAQALKDDVEAAALIQGALDSLLRFYSNNDLGVSLLGRNATEPQYTIDPNKAPETIWSDAKYGGRKAETTGIVAILEMIKEDIEKEIQTTREDDAAAQKQFEKERSGAEDTLNAQQQLKLTAEKQLGDIGDKVDDASRMKTAKGNDLLAENKLKNALYSDCSWVETHFDSRRTKRKNEMDGLIEAKGYLAGVDNGI